MNSKFRTPLGAQGSEVLLAGLATIIGLVVRISAPFQATFPLNDGGLFYRMILDLQANHFVLPLFTTYNSSSIPFAYPPLAFYVTGLLSSVFRLDVLLLLRILPSLLSSSSVFVFYFLCRQILKSGQGLTLAATLAFAFAPRGFEWQIMGGGITRALGFASGLLTLYFIHRLYTNQDSWRQIFPAVIFGTLAVLSHPEASLQTALAVLIFYIVLDRSLKGAWISLVIGAGIILVSAPWWVTVISHHGMGPFLASSSAVQNSPTVNLAQRMYLIFQFNFTEEPNLQLIAIFGLIGLIATLARREFLLALWVIAPLLFEPRSAPQFSVIPLAMLAGIGLVDVVFPALRMINPAPNRLTKRVAGGFLVFVFIYVLYSAYLVGFNIANTLTLQPSDREALVWVRSNTPVNSRFILLTGGNPLADPLAEWFPALTDQKSLGTIFGTEWLSGESFEAAFKGYESLQQCSNQNELCLQRWVAVMKQSFTYVLVRKQTFEPFLGEALRSLPAYQLIYESSRILIFQKIH